MAYSKYKAKKCIVDGISFDSLKEGRRYRQLVLLERARDISDLEIQPKYDLIVNRIKVGFYKADFRYIKNGKVIVEDVKGVKTPVYNLKKRMIKAIYDIDILET